MRAVAHDIGQSSLNCLGHFFHRSELGVDDSLVPVLEKSGC